jgi:DNA-binding CsgD family transcriptional regulator
LPGRGAEAAALAEAASRRLGLTPRERDVVERLLLGETRKEIGRTLAISPRTVDVYVGRLLEKAGMGSTKALIVKLWSEPLSETD